MLAPGPSRNSVFRTFGNHFPFLFSEIKSISGRSWTAFRFALNCFCLVELPCRASFRSVVSLASRKGRSDFWRRVRSWTICSRCGFSCYLFEIISLSYLSTGKNKRVDAKSYKKNLEENDFFRLHWSRLPDSCSGRQCLCLSALQTRPGCSRSY